MAAWTDIDVNRRSVNDVFTNIFNNDNAKASWRTPGINDEITLEWLIQNVKVVKDKHQNLIPDFKRIFTEIVDENIITYRDKLSKLDELQSILHPKIPIMEFVRSKPGNRQGANSNGGSIRFNLNNKTKRSSNSNYKRIKNKSKKRKQV